ncbi:protein-L-isoaspartate(D-aspartate) O-methyltransferase [Halopseudomonas laoshanensis]|jgi:protein-L-isoaspartate(D-aspartate) O-methyltransferase|uniref:Protein-L-isoaspartate O-methyltransferase n=2 Tax=Halopseudomonas TaxID=2901189 RepID=A0A7V7GTM2_9GAMM|nr:MULTISPECIES: protein-L-isoaspartate(D-aspartate) O-methyltransferase [Halopseudomonas]KAA0694676.1 protein-L-isoaspartate(D-aspartate) O-methyltransferase [Halopseudomonas laoshanensis]PCC97509.1 protein-L-isoaspartate O-methyltransferase [Halopseudomonas pelagia]QFY57824.1 protein-L-isoaspartate(D-aspartate) O-methyltransferase [Halopseudomonas pelagia]WOD12467.1 protein-L-isoaspartate(D-aspartate) O-methyltransferase [Pseudomonas sp. NyZ704]
MVVREGMDRQGIGMTSQRTRERLLERLFEEGVRNLRVLEAMRRTPRHLFVDEALAHRAYEDTALPIGHNQTISQPYIVARMTELLLGGGPLDKVMEVGTGSGYQTAILAQVVERVFSVERIHPLQERAKAVLKDINIRNVVFRHADGNWGWPQYGPYDAILVAAAPAEVPKELLNQLADGGRLVIPVGDKEQFLTLVIREGDNFIHQQVEPVRFVPLLAGAIRS